MANKRTVRDAYSPDEIARAIGADPRAIRRWLGLRSARTRVTKAEIRDSLEWFPLDEEMAASEVRLARLVGQRSGEYVELDWLRPPGWPWVTRADPPVRIFAVTTPYDRDAEADARDLIQLYRRAHRLRRLDDIRRRAVAAVDIALRAMRSRERAVLVARLEGKQGKRGSPEVSWMNVASGCDSDSVRLTKEVFKVAVREFLAEYARISELLAKDPDYFH